MSLMKMENSKTNKDPKSYILSCLRMDIFTSQEYI